MFTNLNRRFTAFSRTITLALQFAALITSAIVSTVAVLSTAHAQTPEKNKQASEMENAVAAAKSVSVRGPAEVSLRDQAKLSVPAGYVFIPETQAQTLLRAMGNSKNPSVMGVIFPKEESNEEWMVVASYTPSGYVKDDDAKDWKADELLTSLKEGTEQSNKDRRARGFAEMDIVGWIEKPTYNASAHQLVWSIASRDKGAAASAEQGVNYNTYALGREGYISMNLVTSASTIEKEKSVAKNVLGALNFKDGKRYADFNSSTDHVAEYGLAALVAGVAAKKLGLFAVIGAFLLKFAKLFILLGAGALAVVAKWFGRKKDV
jgi:uncharacterized membrane-anchored protein